MFQEEEEIDNKRSELLQVTKYYPPSILYLNIFVQCHYNYLPIH